MVQYDPRLRLPSSAELPDSDDTPVDNELQNLVPNLLDQVLGLLWQGRDDWFFGVDMGIYTDTEQPYRAIVPDGFLSLGVIRLSRPNGRRSYVLWEENGIMPVLVLEVVSETYRGEYETKLEEYRQLEVRYYVVYDPIGSRQHDVLEVYELVEGSYTRLAGEQIWLEGIGLGIGREEGEFRRWRREWLYWYDESGERYLTPEEYEQYRADLATQRADSEARRADSEAQKAATEAQRAELAQQQLEQLKRQLKELNIDPDLT
ncbi:MAG: Uma2 family endonuclease [Gemmatimonadaceae bacterium]|nr:Uma2 family endonuclease [Gloeobacterales cyanobacterium ES-bin-141]